MRGILLFDIDGVIRDVADSYRLAIQETVNHFCQWRPTLKNIDQLNGEGCWNNDWDTSLELIRRRKDFEKLKIGLPSRNNLIRKFNDFYFGGELGHEDHEKWNGFIKNEKLLVNKDKR